MNILTAENKTVYRRWINIIPSLLLPGSAQFLSGRRKNGILWFLANVFLGIAAICLLLTPKSSYDIDSFHWFDIAQIPFLIGLIIDACRSPIPYQGIGGLGKFFRVYLVIIISSLLAVLLVRKLFIQPFKIPTGAMQPTIMGVTQDSEGKNVMGDHIVVNKTAYWKRTPQRGDIVVFSTADIEHPSVRQNTSYIKRVVGLPGETVSIRPPDIIINGSSVTEPDIFRIISSGEDGYSGFTLAGSNAILSSPDDSITLEVDEYFVLGDNTENSLDSRYFGPINRASIIGKAVYIYAPANRKKRIE